MIAAMAPVRQVGYPARQSQATISTEMAAWTAHLAFQAHAACVLEGTTAAAVARSGPSRTCSFMTAVCPPRPPGAPPGGTAVWTCTPFRQARHPRVAMRQLIGIITESARSETAGDLRSAAANG